MQKDSELKCVVPAVTSEANGEPPAKKPCLDVASKRSSASKVLLTLRHFQLALKKVIPSVTDEVRICHLRIRDILTLRSLHS